MHYLKPNKDMFIKAFIVLFLIVIILYPKASYEGASSGLLLWFHNILPNLLPFIIISNLLISLNISKQISEFFYPVFGRLFGVSKYGCYPIVIGFLSGIPMGAKSTAEMVSEKKLTTREGQFLLSLTNNTSLMFIMGYIAISQLKLPDIKYVLFGIIYLSSIISAYLYRYFFLRNDQNHVIITSNEVPAAFEQNDVKQKHFSFEILDESIMNGFEVITKIGGYVILFSIIAQIIRQTGPESNYIKAFLMGLIEITNGINQVCKLEASDNIKIVLITVLTSFGGLSGIAQTKSVLGQSRLSILSYCYAKIINIIITFLLSMIYVMFFYSN